MIRKIIFLLAIFSVAFAFCEEPVGISRGDKTYSLTFRRADIEIEDLLKGVAWSEDSRKAYFVRFVRIAPNESKVQKIREDRMMQMMLNGVGGVTIPDSIFEPFYGRLQIAELDLQQRAVTILSDEDAMFCGSRSFSSISEKLAGSKLKLSVCGSFNEFDVITKKWERPLGASSDDDHRRKIDFAKNMVSPAEVAEAISGFRFLSPDRSSFVAMVTSDGWTVERNYKGKGELPTSENVVEVFVGQPGSLRTAREAGVTGSALSERAKVPVPKPDYHLNLDNFWTKEESEVRNKLGLQDRRP